MAPNDPDRARLEARCSAPRVDERPPAVKNVSEFDRWSLRPGKLREPPRDVLATDRMLHRSSRGTGGQGVPVCAFVAPVSRPRSISLDLGHHTPEISERRRVQPTGVQNQQQR